MNPKKQNQHKHKTSYPPYKTDQSRALPGDRTRKRSRKGVVQDFPRRKQDERVRLNKYIAQCGICARREADKLIAQGLIKVNGEVTTELGVKVHPVEDQVKYNNKVISPQNFVYILYNKPKNVITTAKDPQGRKTVMDIMQHSTKERIFPVGRLDRNTTGLLLLTNDGDFAKKLTHPTHQVRKVYKVRLDRPFPREDMQKLLQGIELEDGYAKVDKIDYVANSGDMEVGIEIHVGKNRIVRRLFEALSYRVVSLDRTAIAHLTKKKLPRGKWRFLTEKEIAFIKMI